MAYANWIEATDAKNQAFKVFREQYRTGPNTFNVPWSAQLEFKAKWDPIIKELQSKPFVESPQSTTTPQAEPAAAAEPKGMTPNEYEYQQVIDLATIAAQSGEKIATIGSEATLGAAKIGAASASDVARIQSTSASNVARIQSTSASDVARIQKESALGIANIDKQIKQMQLESAENLQKLSNRNKLSLATLATNQSILTGLVNAFNF